MFTNFVPLGRFVVRPPDTVEEEEVEEIPEERLPVEKSDNLLLAEKLARELLSSLRMSDIVARSGVMPSTVRNLASGNAVRVSKKVLFALQRCMNHMHEPLQRPSEHRVAPAASNERAVAPMASAEQPQPMYTSAVAQPPVPDRVRAAGEGGIDLPPFVLLDASAFLDFDGIVNAIHESENRLLRLRQVRDLSRQLWQ